MLEVMAKKSNPYLGTNFSHAWVQFKKSKEYRSISETMKLHGIKQPYRDNLMHLVFVAGWGDKKIFEIT